MTGFERPPDPSLRLRGRRGECEVLGGLIQRARARRSGVLVVRGEAGVGKTALLDYAAEAASDLTVVRVTGVESEMTLAFAALHQVCGPMLDHLGHLPGPQREALGTAFGLSDGPAPDRFLVCLAVLGLWSGAAEERPRVCLVDDAQWLDPPSAQALGFAARRLPAEPLLLVFAAREPGADLGGLPQLLVEGLRDADARDLLNSVVRWPLDERVRERILAETRGNPRALLDLTRGRSSSALAGGFELPDATPPSGRAEESVRRQLAALPAPSRLLLQLAAADPVGDTALVWRAAGQLGIPAQAATPAADAGLLEFGTRARFGHPLVRSAAYRSASLRARQDVHRALAEVTDPHTDPDRRAWHRAQATPGPDDEVAADLERSVGRAQSRGGLAAAAAFLERAATLTPSPELRAERALAAARAKVQVGAYDAAHDLLGMAQAGRLDRRQRARVDLVRAQLAFVSRRGSDAPQLLLEAAERLEPVDADTARAAYLDALKAAWFAGRLAAPGAGVQEVSSAARGAPPTSRPPRAPDLLLDGLAAHFTQGYAAAQPVLARAVSSFGREMSPEEELRCLWPASLAAVHLWDDHAWDVLSDRHLKLARDAGALSELPLALGSRASLRLCSGELDAAASLVAEARAVTEATGGHLVAFGALGLAALQGRADQASALIAATRDDVALRGEGIGITAAHWATAVLDNGLGRYDQALTAAGQAVECLDDLGLTAWSLVELIEAAARTGSLERADDALRRLSLTTRASGTDWALGIEARSRALLTRSASAERLYREAIERLGRTRLRAELGRAVLLYGEWLRRENRRVDARAQLRRAHEMLTAMGLEAFARRARRELLATGATVRRRTVETAGELTPQEAQIARLAADGLSNPEISTQLFLSPRTVEWHLRKVFTKLGIGSRRQLRAALRAPGGPDGEVGRPSEPGGHRPRAGGAWTAPAARAAGRR